LSLLSILNFTFPNKETITYTVIFNNGDYRTLAKKDIGKIILLITIVSCNLLGNCYFRETVGVPPTAAGIEDFMNHTAFDAFTTLNDASPGRHKKLFLKRLETIIITDCSFIK
jgi:hypothetical protein